MTQRYDVLVIGAGPGGYTCAHRAAELGLSVAVAEPGPLGGTCLNVGCIPTKGLLLAPDPEGIAHRVAANRAAVERLQRGVGHLLKGCTVLTGRAQITGPGTAAVAGHGEVAAEHMVIATGSAPLELDALPFGGRVISSDHAVAPETVPETLAIIGAGAVGCEFADVFAAYGSRVTVFEREDRLVPELDPFLATQLARAFKKRGIAVRTGEAVDAAAVAGFDRVLVAVGRRPVTDGLGLETVGITPDASGFIVVDGTCRTGADGIRAVGDVTGPPLLAHRAYAQGRVCAEAIAGGSPDPIDPGMIPYCVYTHPQLASVGRVFAENAGLAAHEARFAANGLAVVKGAAEGAVRIVAEERSGRIVGAQLAGPEVTEMIGLLGALITAGGGLADLRRAVFPHPTLSEVVWEAGGTAPDSSGSRPPG